MLRGKNSSREETPSSSNCTGQLLHNGIPSAPIEHTNDPDVALEALQQLGGANRSMDEATNKSLLKKIDLMMMPILCIVYGLNYLDKTTLAYASVMGISSPEGEGGIGLTGDQYNWLASLFYFGYMAWEWPTSRLLQYLPIGKYMAFNIIAWGAVLCCLAATKSFSGAATARFLLGVFEASVSPGFVLLTSQWYTKNEQGTRTGIWFSFNGIAQVFGGFVSYGVLVGASEKTFFIEPWRVLFLIAGSITVTMGVVFAVFIPDNQLNAWWLRPADRSACIERIRGNQQGIGNRHWKPYQFREALTDPLSWAFALYSLLANIPNGGITSFFSLIIRSFGYTAEQSLLYGAPGGAVQIFALVTSGYLGDRLGNRLLVSSTGLVGALVGMLLIATLPETEKGGRLAGFYINQTAIAPFVALISLVSSNVAGYTKKTTVAAMFLIAYAVGNIIGPQTFRGSSYAPAEWTFIGCYVVCSLDVLFIWWYCRRMNHQKAAIRQSPGYQKMPNQEWLDLTDRENPEFTYVL